MAPAIATAKTPMVTVVMGTYNGAVYLREQLDTILEQTVRPQSILVGDDGSTDKSRDIIASYGAPVQLIEGPRQGYAANYLNLLTRVPVNTDYVAISDQDDHWLPHKLERAIQLLSSKADGDSALYGSQSWVCDAHLSDRKLSRKVSAKAVGFRHALTQNFAGGNTYVLNNQALRLVQSADVTPPSVHDWWLYLLISGAGGKVIYDEAPNLLYRQHSTNLIGANDRLNSHVKRTQDMLSGVYRSWNSENLRALSQIKNRLTPDARSLLQLVNERRDGRFISRLSLMTRNRIYRQSAIGQIGLALSLMLKKY